MSPGAASPGAASPGTASSRRPRTVRRRAPLPPRTGVQPPRAIVRRSTESWALQSALERHGLGPVAGVDEAGRGACAGPLAVAAAILRPGDAARFDGLTDSKLLTHEERERFRTVIERRAVDWCVVLVDPTEIDRRGVHAANIEGMRRAVARLGTTPGYVLTDGFPVSGFRCPSLAVPKGDLAAACVAAASILAKTTRDRIMTDLAVDRPEYGFEEHKGYCTPSHSAALRAHGPCVDHRFSFVNVAAAVREPLADGAAGRLGPVRHNGTADGGPSGRPDSEPGPDEASFEPAAEVMEDVEVMAVMADPGDLDGFADLTRVEDAETYREGGDTR